MRRLITNVNTRNDFLALLRNNNPTITILKFGATWCSPCKLVHPHVIKFYEQLPVDVNVIDLNINISPDIYAWLKNKKMVSGIPVIMRFDSGNVSFVPDDICTGVDIPVLHTFFNNCMKKYKENHKS